MYPRTNEERKEHGVKWETEYTTCGGESISKLILRIFDKSGNVRSKVVFEKDDVQSLKDVFDRFLGES